MRCEATFAGPAEHRALARREESARPGNRRRRSSRAGGEFTATCDAGQKAVAGGWEDPAGWGHPWDTRPTPDGSGWRTWVSVNSQAPGAQTGTVYAICLK